MQRFKNILVVLDHKINSEALIERAVILSQRNQARLTVVTVAEEMPRDIHTLVAADSMDIYASAIDIIETLPPDKPAPITSHPPDAPRLIGDTQEALSTEEGIPVNWESPQIIQEQINKSFTNQLEQVIASLRQREIQVTSKVLYGTPFIEIIREVLRNGYDLVMITAEGRSGLKEMLFGRTTMHLMRKCPCPVWVMNPAQPKRYSHILAAVDPNPPDQERSDLNIKIMDLATSLAQREQCELLIIHTWSFPLESHVRSGRLKVPQSKIDEWIHDLKDERRRSLSSLLGKYNLNKLKYQV